MSRELMQQALEKLEFFAHMKSVSEGTRRLITALRQALETEQEPVAWLDPEENISDEAFTWSQSKHHTVPLYTAPQKKEWVGLTEEEVNDCIKLPNRNLFARDGTTSQRIARAIEAKLKEKNA